VVPDAFPGGTWWIEVWIEMWALECLSEFEFDRKGTGIAMRWCSGVND
jgi:hypothetical protein